MPDLPNAYQEAIRQVDSTITFMMSTANEWLNTTQDAIVSLGQWQPAAEGTPPNLQPDQVEPRDLPEFPPPDPTMFGEVGDLTVPGWEDLSSLVDEFDPYDPGDFNPTTSLPNIPDPPAPIDTSGAPSRPAIADVTLPPDPDFSMPVAPGLADITIPPVPTITIPDIDIDQVPVFDTPVPDLAFTWEEQDYTPQVLAELTATIKAMLAGDFAMPQVVQDALFAAAIDREDRIAQKAEADAFDAWAGRGFDMPPGMLVEQVNAARERAELAANSLSRDVFTKAAQWQIENLRTAVAQGIALESMWSGHWNQVAQRAFDAARVLVEVAKDQFNLHASAFNLAIANITAKRDVFEARLRGELAKLDVMRAELEAAQLTGTINEQRVRVYTSQLEGVRVIAAVFSERLNAAKIRADNERSKIDLYKTDVEAWAERLRADKTRFDAYESRVRGESAKVGAYEAEARAYAATVAAAADRNAARNRVVEAKLQAIEVATRKFLGLLQGNLGVVTSRRDAISARAQAFGADTERWGQQLRYAAQGEEIRIRAQEATMRNNLAYFDTISRQFDSRMQRLLQAGVALKDAIAQAGQMSAQMAAGAMSAIHASANISGSGSESSSTNYSYDMTPDA